jgi:hypothetical protein
VIQRGETIILRDRKLFKIHPSSGPKGAERSFFAKGTQRKPIRKFIPEFFTNHTSYLSFDIKYLSIYLATINVVLFLERYEYATGSSTVV